MSKLDVVIEKINRYLRNRNLEKMNPEEIQGDPQNLTVIYEAALRSIWKIEDKEQKDAYAVDIAQFLNPYFGGRNVNDALQDISDKLDKEFAIKKEEEKVQVIKDKLKDPDYVPTFEELLKAKNENIQ